MKNLRRVAENVGLLLTKVRVGYLGWLYFIHLKFRYLHDITYSKGGVYKKWTDRPYSHLVHRTVIVTFILSFGVFSLAQGLFPYVFNVGKPQKVFAAQKNVKWDSQANFNGTTAPANSGIEAPYTITQNPTNTANFTTGGLMQLANTEPIDLSTGTDLTNCNVSIATGNTVTIANLYNLASNTGVSITNASGRTCSRNGTSGFNLGATPYDPVTNKIPIFNNLTLSGTLTTTAQVQLVFKVAGTFSGNGTINANGMGFGAEQGPAPGLAGTSVESFGEEEVEGSGGGGGGHNASGKTGHGGWSPPSGSVSGASGGIVLATSTFPAMGSGGGNGGPAEGVSGGGGGSGGGVIISAVANTTFIGQILAKGSNGSVGDTVNLLIGGQGGGGSGGSIHFLANSGTIDGSKFSVQGGDSGWAGANFGNGAGGRIKVQAPTITNSNSFNYAPGPSGDNVMNPNNPSGNWGRFIVASYNTSSAVSGYKIDTGSGSKVRWSSIDWNYQTSNTTNYKIFFKVRTSALGSSWSDWSPNINANTLTGNAAISALATDSRFLEVEVNLSSTDGMDTPKLDWFQVNYDTVGIISANSYRVDDNTQQLYNNRYTNESSITLKAEVNTVDTSILTPTVQVKTSAGGAYQTPAALGLAYSPLNPSASSGNSDQWLNFGTLSGLSPGTDYYWRIMVSDSSSRASTYSADVGPINIDQSVPAISVFNINGGEQFTNTTAVNLNITAADTGDSTLTSMRFSNDGTFDSEPWEPYSATMAWTLLAGDGVKTVYAQVKDGAGNVSVDSPDGITLDSTAPAVVANLKGYDSAGKNTEYQSGQWKQDQTPYFEWAAVTKDTSGGDDVSGIAGYKYCLGAVDCSPTTNTTNPNYAATLAAEAQVNFRVVAYDNAGNVNGTPTPFVYGYDITAPSNIDSTTFRAPKAESDETTIILHWSPATDSLSGVAGYQLERKLFTAQSWSGDIIPISGSGTNVYIDSGLSAGVKYSYRIKAIDSAGVISLAYASLDASTRDTRKPSDITSLTAAACNGVDNCSNPANNGFEVKLTWSPATDLGVGVTGYKVYRKLDSHSFDPASYTLVGYKEIDPPQNDPGPVQYTYYDNSTNAAAAYTDTIDDVADVVIKAASGTSNDLVDYHHYYYRVTALDAAGNESFVTLDDQAEEIINKADALTPDVGNPSEPANLTAAAVGLDPSGNAQQIDVSWSASVDSGSGVAGYIIKRTTTAYVNSVCVQPAGPEVYADLATTVDTIYHNTGLDEFTCYWYSVQAVDRANSSNISDAENNRSDVVYLQTTPRTSSNQVPSAPTSVTVNALKGDPNTERELPADQKNNWAEDNGSIFRCQD